MEARRSRLQPVLLLLRVRGTFAALSATPELEQHLKDIDAHLHALTRDEAEYAAMMRSLPGTAGPAPSLPSSAVPE
jgi:hypothetical protein